MPCTQCLVHTFEDSTVYAGVRPIQCFLRSHRTLHMLYLLFTCPGAPSMSSTLFLKPNPVANSSSNITLYIERTHRTHHPTHRATVSIRLSVHSRSFSLSLSLYIYICVCVQPTPAEQLDVIHSQIAKLEDAIETSHAQAVNDTHRLFFERRGMSFVITVKCLLMVAFSLAW